MPKMDVRFGLKVHNTKGGYFLDKEDKHHIERKYVDIDGIGSILDNSRMYLIEGLEALEKPLKSGWQEFMSISEASPDIRFTFVVDKPYPATIEEIYSKVKLLPSYKEL